MKFKCPSCDEETDPAAGKDTCPACGSPIRVELQPTLTYEHSDDAASRFTESRASELPQIEGYQILGEIARGGMGVVYEARQLRPNRPVALKMLLRGRGQGPAESARFLAEADAAASLRHEAIVPIFEVGEQDGKLYYSMALVTGGDLADSVSEAPLSGKETARRMRPVCEAVHFAHTRNIVHRDLKPRNILLDENGQPKVSDFGLAKNTTDESGMTIDGQILGTPSYMAPEQALGRTKEIGPLSDVYALGAVIYFLLTRRPPFRGTPTSVLHDVIHSSPVRPRELNKNVDVDMETICLKCLTKEPDQRYASAAALADDLLRYERGHTILARPVGPVLRLRKWCRRNPIVATLAFALIVILVGTGAGLANLTLLAQSEAQRARDSSFRARLRAYVSDMYLIQVLREQPDFRRAQRFLARNIPLPEEEDLRGIEWQLHRRALEREIKDNEFDIGHRIDVAAYCPKTNRYAFLCGHAKTRKFIISDDHGRNLETHEMPHAEYLHHTWSHDGRFIYAVARGHLDRLDPVSGSVLQTYEDERLQYGSKVVVGASGERLYALMNGHRASNTAVNGGLFTALSLPNMKLERELTGVRFVPDMVQPVANAETIPVLQTLPKSRLVLWSPTSGEIRRSKSLQTPGDSSFTASPDGGRLILFAGNSLQMLDVKDLSVLARIPIGASVRQTPGAEGHQIMFAWSKDGRRLACLRRTAVKQELSIWDVFDTTMQLRDRFDVISRERLFRVEIQELRFTSDELLQTVDNSGRVRSWQLRLTLPEELKLSYLSSYTARTTGTSLSSNGRWLVVGSLRDSVSLFDLDSGEEVWSVNNEDMNDTSPNGVTPGNGVMRTVTITQVVPTSPPLAFSANNELLICGRPYQKDAAFTVDFRRVSDGTLVEHRELPARVFNVVPDGDSGKFLACSEAGLFRFGQDADTEFEWLMQDPVFSVARSSQGIVAALFKDKVQLRNQGQQLLQTFPVAEGRWGRLCFDSTGEFVACSSQRIIQAWHSDTAETVLEVEHTEPVSAIRFAPDGRTLLTLGADGVRCWNLLTGELVTHLQEYRSQNALLEIRPDGSSIVCPTPWGTNTLVRGVNLLKTGARYLDGRWQTEH